MAINQNNSLRIIKNAPDVLGETYTYNLSTEEVIITGALYLELQVSDTNNDMDLAVFTFSDLEKPDWIANYVIKVGDIVFDQWVDGGASLPLACNVSLGDEFESDADIAAFLATQTIEIIITR